MNGSEGQAPRRRHALSFLIAIAIAISLVPFGASSSALGAATTVRLVLKVTGAGSVTGASGRLKCPGACSVNVKLGSLIALTANPTRTGIFDHWSEGCAGAASSCFVYADSPIVVNAVFSPAAQIQAAVSGNGSVTGAGLKCGPQSAVCRSFTDVGATAELVATAGPNSSFAGWGGACAGAGTATSCTVTAAQRTDVAAAFDLLAPVAGTASLTFVGPARPLPLTPTTSSATPGSTTVPSTSPIGDCPGNVCLLPTPPSFQPTLTTLSGPDGTSPLSWSGGCVGYGPVCLIVVDHSTTVASAVLIPEPPGDEPRCPLAAMQSPCENPNGQFLYSAGANGGSTGPGSNVGDTWSFQAAVAGKGVITGPSGFACGPSSGRPKCSANVASGYQLVLTATPLRGHRFVRWKTGCETTNATCTTAVYSALEVVAVFTNR